MNGAIARANERLASIPGAVLADQFGNPANPRSTARPPPRRYGTTPTARWM